jgi:hypothetical protein
MCNWRKIEEPDYREQERKETVSPAEIEELVGVPAPEPGIRELEAA